MKKAIKLVAHGLAWMSILFLSGYILKEQYAGYHALSEKTIAETLIGTSDQVRTGNKKICRIVSEDIWRFGGYERALDSLSVFKTIQASVDTLLQEVDGLAANFQENRAIEVANTLQRLKIKAAAVENTRLPARFPVHPFSRSDSSERWLIQAHSKYTPNVFTLLLNQVKSTAVVYEDIIGKHYFEISSPDYCGFRQYFPATVFQSLNYMAGDSLSADVFLADYVPRFHYTSVELNGKKLPFDESVAPFKIPLNTPGEYPLHLVIQCKNPDTDSIETFEKTYSIKVGVR